MEFDEVSRGSLTDGVPLSGSNFRLCALRLSAPQREIYLCAVVFVLRLFAARATPIVREVLERDAVMFGGIVDVAADGADVFAGRRLEDDFAHGNDGGRIVEIDDALLREAFQRFRRWTRQSSRKTPMSSGSWTALAMNAASTRIRWKTLV